jgi:hypothetical protein
LITETDDALFCDGCADRLRAGEAIAYWLPAEEEPSPPPEERFGELFKAARVLLRERIADEDLIYPTLAYANELGQEILEFKEEASMLASAWNGGDQEPAVKRFLQRHDGMVPIDVVDGVVILSWIPVDGGVRMYPIPDEEIPEEVTIRILPHTRRLEPEHIASVYESILSSYEVSYGKSGNGGIDFEFAGGELLVRTFASTDTASRIPPEHAAAIFRDRKPEFIHPRLMAAFCQTLLGSGTGDGFARILTRRKRGDDPSHVKLIPACVAFYLKEYGGLRGKAAHRLLNKHLSGYVAKFPEQGSSESPNNELWRDAKKAGQKLLTAAHAIYEYDPEHTAYLVPRLH